MAIKRIAVIAFVALVAISLSAVAYAAKRPSNAHVRGVVLFVGDSNLMLSAGPLQFATNYAGHNDSGYIPVVASRVGGGLRTFDCAGDPFAAGYTCPTYNHWQIRLPEILKQVKPSAVVVNLGINDTFAPGTRNTQGYASYGRKIDDFLKLLPKSIPILWTNLPCDVEPQGMKRPCRVVNAALRHAPARWKHLSIVPWGGYANAHPEWMFAGDVHMNGDGDTAWVNVVVAALDAKLKPKT